MIPAPASGSRWGNDPANPPPCACCARPTEPEHADPGWLRAARRAVVLSWASLLWMSVEGAVGLIAGVVAGSVALVGWALSSAVEGMASLIVIWRFTGSRRLSETAEARSQRAVAISLWLLVPYIAIEAARELAAGQRPTASALGIVLTATSVVLMPVLAISKRRLARRLDSAATAGEGAQNLLCAYLGAAVLIGLAGNAVFGWWWLDPLAAFAVAGVAVREGLESWRGESCAC